MPTQCFFLTSEVGSGVHTEGATERLVELDPILLGSRVGWVASTLEATIDSVDRGTEAVAVDHGIVASGRGASHPEPHGRLERDGGVGRDDARVVDPVEADGVAGGLVVGIPGELEGAAAVVLLAVGTRDAGGGVAVSVLVDLLHVLPA